MAHGERKGAWHFDAMWTLPANMIGSTSFADRSCALDELESAFMRDVVERTTFPMNTINVEIKYKLSDLEVALNNPPNQLSVTGYIQSKRQTMCKCSASLPSQHAVQARNRCVFAQILVIWIS